MNIVAGVAVMAAARRQLQYRNPELLNWSSARWTAWLDLQRNHLAPSAGPPIVVLAAITCLADLNLHVGLMQLLTMGLNCRVVFWLPTDGAARIARAQARREEWEGLVDIVNEAQVRTILDSLPDSAAIGLFGFPDVVPAEVLTNERFLADRGKAAGENLLKGRNAFLGLAADCRRWFDRRAENEQACASLRRVLSHDFKQPIARHDVPSGFSERQPEPIERTATVGEGCIRLDVMRHGDDLLVESIDERTQATVIVHRYGEVCTPMQQLKIRAPATLLTTSPRRIRVRCIRADGKCQTAELLFSVPPGRLQPWMVAAFLNRGGGGNPVIRAFAKSIGCRIAYAEDEPEELRDIPVVWGVLRDSDRIIAQAKEQDLYFFYVDHAYFNRGHGKAYRITRNAYEAGAIRKCAEDRLAMLNVTVEPWRKSGREVIVCPPTEYFMKAHGCPDWLETTLTELRRVTDRPVIVREKPKPGESVVPLPDALRTAHALVTHSSNVAIEAACFGTPVFVSPGSAAAPIGRTELSDLESPAYPDRSPWLAHLAYNQFSFDEIRDGTAWRLLVELEEYEFA